MESNAILVELTNRQYLDPHRSILESLDRASAALGFCPKVAGEAMRWLELDPEYPVGRLRRTELTQLARTIHRLVESSKSWQTQGTPE